MEMKTLSQDNTHCLQKIEQLHVLRLYGKPQQRARTHGELISKGFLSRGNLELFNALLTRGLTPGSLRYRLTDQFLNSLTQWVLKAAPDDYKLETKVMAEALKVSPLRLRRALLLPDIASYSWALLSKQGKNLPPTVGCTSAVYTDSQGRFLYGRNLDFPGSPAYDRNPLLIIHQPDSSSSELQHASVGTHGLQFSGITGFNEAGLTFCVHQNYTRLLSIRGVPMPFVGEQVLRYARNLKEALQIIRENRPGPLWSFVVTDTHKGHAMVVDVSNTQLKVRYKESSPFIQTNHLLDSTLRQNSSLLEAGTASNSAFRFQKAQETLKSWGTPEPHDMAQLLSWQKSRKFFSSISDVQKSLTIQSVMFQKDDLKGIFNFYVTIDSAPAPSGRWLKIPIQKIWTHKPIDQSELEIHQFTKLTSEERKRQLQWADLYADESMRNYSEVVKKLAPLANSPDSFLALSSMQLKNKQLPDSLSSAQCGLQICTNETQPLIHQGLLWMEIVGYWHLKKRKEVTLKTQAFLKLSVQDPELLKQAQRVLKKKRPSTASLSPGFDFFGGYLQGMPSRSIS